MFDIFVSMLMIICVAVLIYVGYRIGFSRGFCHCYDEYIGVYKDEEQIEVLK